MESKLGLPPQNRKDYTSQLGRLLVAKFGKKKFYLIIEVIEADDKIDYIDKQDIPWWGIGIFCTYEDFKDLYIREFGEEKEESKIVDLYDRVRSEILSEVVEASLLSVDEAPLLHLETSWLDFGDSEGSIFEEIADFFISILD